VNDSDVIAFSYSGKYLDCNTGQQYTAHDFPGATSTPDIQLSSLLPLTPAPDYSKSDTCHGVEQASQHLEALVNQTLRLEPDARIVLIGHSLGGMVAAYYVSQQPAAFVEEKIQKVVTVDSPLLGFPERHPRSVCSRDAQSWQDIFGNSDMVLTISGIRNQPMVEKFYAINSTDIGDALMEDGLMTLGCASVRTAGGAKGGVVLGILGLLLGNPAGLLDTLLLLTPGLVGTSLYGEGHSCAFADEQALYAFSSIVNNSVSTRSSRHAPVLVPTLPGSSDIPASTPASQASSPHVIMGTVTMDGLVAPIGTPVVALIGGEPVGSDTVRAGGAFGPMQVQPGEGTEIIFLVGSLTADQTATWQSGGANVLNLTARSGP
jgi:hypothetical protein